MEIEDSRTRDQELAKLRLELDACKARLAERDRTVLDLIRKLRRFEDLRILVEDLKERLAEKEQEASGLVRDVTRRNQRLARIKDPRARI